MADTKMPGLPAITGANMADNDQVLINDVSDTVTMGDAGGTNKVPTVLEFAKAMETRVTVPAAQLTVSKIGAPTYTQLQQVHDLTRSAGHLNGGAITPSGTSVNVAAGQGFIRATGDDTSTLFTFNWPAPSALAIPADTIRFIVVEYNSGTPQVVLYTGETYDFRTAFPLGFAINEGGVLYINDTPHNVGRIAGRVARRNYEVDGRSRANELGGLVISQTGTRNVAVTAGVTWLRGTRDSFSGIDTAVTGSFDRYYVTAGVWTRVAAQTAFQNTQYNNVTTGPQTLSNNNRVCEWFYLGPSGAIASVMGRQDNNNLTAAIAEPPPASLPLRLQQGAILLGRTITIKSAASAELVQSAFGVTFSGSVPTAHGDLAGLTVGDDHTQYQLRTEKNAANGYAGLSAGSKLTGSQQTYGSAVNTAAEGNDARLSDARTPTSHVIATNVSLGAQHTISGATAGQVLRASAATAANFQQLAHADLSAVGTNTHAQIDTHLAAVAPHSGHEVTTAKNAASGYAGLDGSSKLAGAQQVYGSAANTAAQGNDSRLSDDRTAAGVRTATTVVAVSAAAAPTVGQVLTATGSTAATWQTPAGGGASPGGATGDVQYNNAGAFAGASKLDIQAEGLPLIGELTTTNPTLPASGVAVFARNRSGRRMLGQVGPSGVDYAFQPFMGANSCNWYRPAGNGTVVTNNGLAVATAYGTAVASASWANTNLRTSLKRAGYASAATAGANGGMKSNVLQFWRGNAAGLGGFSFVCRFGLALIPTGNRIHCGLFGSVTAPANVDPSTFINSIGVGWDVADTDVQFMHNDGTGTATKTSTGVLVSAITTASVMEVRVWCAPNTTTVSMSFEVCNGGTPVDFTSGATKLPATTAGLLPHLWTNNGATASIITADLVGMYIETDY